MDDLFSHLLSRSPVWLNLVFIAAIIGQVVFIIANRQYAKQTKAAHEEQLKLKDESYALLKQHHVETLSLLRESIVEVSKDRDAYRDKLHAEKDSHQVTTLKLAEADARPDLTDIIESIQSHNTEMIKLMVKLEIEIKKQSVVVEKSVMIMDSLIKNLISKGILPSEFSEKLES